MGISGRALVPYRQVSPETEALVTPTAKALLSFYVACAT
jgi:hypothetical protein